MCTRIEDFEIIIDLEMLCISASMLNDRCLAQWYDLLKYCIIYCYLNGGSIDPLQ